MSRKIVVIDNTPRGKAYRDMATLLANSGKDNPEWVVAFALSAAHQFLALRTVADDHAEIIGGCATAIVEHLSTLTPKDPT